MLLVHRHLHYLKVWGLCSGPYKITYDCFSNLCILPDGVPGGAAGVGGERLGCRVGEGAVGGVLAGACVFKER